METILSKKLRPNERVRDYLERGFLAEPVRVETRLPTIEAIASHLGVGISTVRSVLRKLSDEGRVETRKGQGTVVVPVGSEVVPWRLAADIGPIGLNPDRLDWAECITLGAARMSATMKHPISMLPIAPQKGLPPGEVDRELLRLIDSIDLLMLFPGRDEESRDPLGLVATFEAAGKPVVNINPRSLSATTNFVSANFFEVAYRIGRSWHRSGRRRFLFLVPAGRMEHVSAQLYLSGFGAGSRRDEDRSVRFEVCLAETNTEEAGETAARRVLLSPEPPDAVLCYGDFLASGFLKALQGSRLRVPEEISLIGGTGLPSTRERFPELNIILQPMAQIGAGAVRLLAYRKENDGLPVPGLYLSCTISEGRTVRPEELALMELPV